LSHVELGYFFGGLPFAGTGIQSRYVSNHQGQLSLLPSAG